DRIVDAAGAMHTGVTRRLGAGLSVVPGDLGEEIRIKVVGLRGRSELDDAKDRAIGRRRDADLAGGSVRAARIVRWRRVGDPEVEHLAAELGLAAGLRRDIVEADDCLAAGVMGSNHAPNAVCARHLCSPPLVAALDLMPDRVPSRDGNFYHGAAAARKHPGNRWGGFKMTRGAQSRQRRTTAPGDPFDIGSTAVAS